MPLTLGQLFSETTKFYKAHLNLIVTAAIVFAVVLGTAGGVMQKKAQHAITGSMGHMMGGQFDQAKMEDLARRVQAGDPTAEAEIEAMMADMEKNMENMQDPAAAMQQMMPFIGAMTGFGIVMMLISYLSWTFFLLVGTDLTTEFADGVTLSIKKFLPMLGLGIWAILRSFAWVPFIGPILGLIIAPRLFAASVIYLKEGKGIMESTKLSYERTKGYWFKIFGNMLVVVIAMIVVGLIAQVVVMMLGFLPMIVTSIASSLVQQLMMAYMIIFTVQLAYTIIKNPAKN